MFALLKTFCWQELRHHPWRHGAAVVAIMLGVALAFAVQLINASALSEFAQASKAVSGEPDLVLRSLGPGFDERWYARVAMHPAVAAASPVVDLNTRAVRADGSSLELRVLGVDALQVGLVAPALLPRLAAGEDRQALFAPDTVFLNPAAQQALSGGPWQLQRGLRLQTLRAAGTVAAAAGPLAVMDIAAVQDLFDKGGLLSRVDLRLRPGADRAALVREWQADPAFARSVTLVQPEEASERLDGLSRAYRVNLSVLALVALFTGAFLVFSVLSLSVAQRTPQFALLGVLGLGQRARSVLVLAEALALGLLGSTLGLALGTALAQLALRQLGGDLGGGYFSGLAPALQWDGRAALIYGVLGVAAALLGAWWPAQQMGRLAPAQALKGLGDAGAAPGGHGWGLALLLLGVGLALLPPVQGMALGAYLSVALLLLGGIGLLPWCVALVYDRLAPHLGQHPLAMLAVERARRVRASAAVAVSGVVASLSLSIALTVMVASFRDSMMHWLDSVLPADLYVRLASGPQSSEVNAFTPAFVDAVQAVPGVQRLSALRILSIQLQPSRPAVTLLARDMREPQRSLPLLQAALAPPPGAVAIYVSEAVVDLYGARLGGDFSAVMAPVLPSAAPATRFFVAGVWRDYARQHGAIAIDRADYQRLWQDAQISDLALWLSPQAQAPAVEAGIRRLSPQGGLLQFASTQDIRALSLRLFDRSFAVTYWLQAVAIAIGLFGVAASFGAQVLARRKEFGLLSHLGLTRAQVLAVVAGEGAAWTLIGSLAGLLLGLAVSVVLVKVVNPQSFHWTMDMALPWPRLFALCGAVVLAGTASAWLAGRAAASRHAVLAVKEDW